MTSITLHKNWPSVSALGKERQQFFNMQANPLRDLGHKTPTIIHFLHIHILESLSIESIQYIHNTTAKYSRQTWPILFIYLTDIDQYKTK